MEIDAVVEGSYALRRGVARAVEAWTVAFIEAL